MTAEVAEQSPRSLLFATRSDSHLVAVTHHHSSSLTWSTFEYHALHVSGVFLAESTGPLLMTFDLEAANELIGKRKSDLTTPRLCLELDAFENNVGQVADGILAAKKSWRPHSNCHKSPHIGQRLSDFGAIGMTCATVSIADVFQNVGTRDVLLTQPPIGAKDLQRVALLARDAKLIVACDHYVQAQAISKVCLAVNATCGVLVEINVGANRAGVRPGRDTRELALAVNQLPGLTLRGVFGNDRHAQLMTDAEVKQPQIEAAHGILAQAKSWFDQKGLRCDIVSVGETSTFQPWLRYETVTEVRAGGAIFGDPYYASLPDVAQYIPALSVLATVVSRPSFDRAIIDAGNNAIRSDRHPTFVSAWPDARIVAHDSEQSILELGPESRELRIGDQVDLSVGDSDLTTMLHDHYVCIRDERVESIWPIMRRGNLL